MPIAGLRALPRPLGFPLVLLPLHIAFLETYYPACSIVFENEPEETDVMLRGPRPVRAKLLLRGLLV